MRNVLFPRLVLQLGVLSLLNDISSEMVFPLFPLFLMTLPGGGPVAIGIIEGIAETTGTVLKLASGLWSDRIGSRVPFVAFGYSLAGIARTLIGAAGSWPGVLVLRFLDRAGKGVRGAPRDALVADSVAPELRGRAFGFQRMMDHTGAVAGPLVAMLLMGAFGFSVRQVIFLAGIPAVALVAVLFSLREPKHPALSPPRTSEPAPRRVPRGKDYRLLTAAAFVFTLGNSTDAFLILALAGAGVSSTAIAFLWSLHHLARFAGAWIGGRSADFSGSKPAMFAALVLYAGIYLVFGASGSVMVLIPVFILFGVSIGMIEPAEGSWIARLSRSANRGSAYGFYNAAKGFAALPASVGFGLIWDAYGRFAAFATGAGLAFIAAIMLVFVAEGRYIDREAPSSED